MLWRWIFIRCDASPPAVKFIIDFAIAPNARRHTRRPCPRPFRDNILFSFGFVLGDQTTRFHLNVLLFYKYKLWPLNTFYTDDDTMNETEKKIWFLFAICACVRPNDPKIDLKCSFMVRARDRRVIFTPFTALVAPLSRFRMNDDRRLD